MELDPNRLAAEASRWIEPREVVAVLGFACGGDSVRVFMRASSPRLVAVVFNRWTADVYHGDTRAGLQETLAAGIPDDIAAEMDAAVLRCG